MQQLFHMHAILLSDNIWYMDTNYGRGEEEDVMKWTRLSRSQSPDHRHTTIRYPRKTIHPPHASQNSQRHVFRIRFSSSL